MSHALDPWEKVASRRESELGGDGLEYTLLIAEERRDPREYPELGDWLELRGTRWLVLGQRDERGTKLVSLERLSRTRRGQHRYPESTLLNFQKRFLAAKVLGKRTNAEMRRAVVKQQRKQRSSELLSQFPQPKETP